MDAWEPGSKSRKVGTQATRPARGLICLGSQDTRALGAKLVEVLAAARSRVAPGLAPSAEDIAASERIAIAYQTNAELAEKADRALSALETRDASSWKALRAGGIFRGSGPAPKVAFLFPGQGSQYVGMLAGLREREAIVRDTFAEADEAMEGKLPRRLTDFVFAGGDPVAADLALRETQVCQPAMLAADLAVLRLLAAHGIGPDTVMGHSLGEYAALVAAGAMPFADAMLAVSARANEMAGVSIADLGRMASIFATEDQVRAVLAQVSGYVAVANFNSHVQTVIGGATVAVEEAVRRFEALGVWAVFLPVSHAFHTDIVAPASEPLRAVLSRLNIGAPAVPVVSNVTGGLYPTGSNSKDQVVDLLARQMAAPVQFVRGLQTLYGLGTRLFVEIGPKKVLASFAENVLADKGDVLALFTNHPKKGDEESFSEALAGLFAAGIGRGTTPERGLTLEVRDEGAVVEPRSLLAAAEPVRQTGSVEYEEFGRMSASFLDAGFSAYLRHFGAAVPDAVVQPLGSVVISGASLGVPGLNHRVFDDANVDRVLYGESLIDRVSAEVKREMVERRVVRLVKDVEGNGWFEEVSDTSEVIKLAGQKGEFDLAREYGIAPERMEAFDITTQLAVAAALDALRDAGIPLVRRYKRTTKGTLLPDRWTLPESMADETGVVFASAFPGFTALLDEVGRFHADRARRERLAELVELRCRAPDEVAAELDSRIIALQDEIARMVYAFDRKFLFRVLSMGHSQLAEFIGARGPNSAVNAACASGSQALGVANDWIKAGRCRRVVVVGADDITNEKMLPWFGAGFLAAGTAAIDDRVEEAALPFDRRRHGLIVGMAASGLVLESEDAVRERGMRGIAEVLGVEVANSAFHVTRMDLNHISEVMGRLVRRVEAERDLDRHRIASHTVFVTHESYSPARGGSASAEIHALREVFGDQASQVVIANTKGMTGHPMGAGLEDVVAVKILEKGIVPAVPHLEEPDPELGDLRMSKGGQYPVRFALRLAAGFGSQVIISLLQKVKGPRTSDAATYQEWLNDQSGRASAHIEIDHRTLRVCDEGIPSNPAAQSQWIFGAGPTLRAESEDAGAPPADALPALDVTVEVPVLFAPVPAPVAQSPEGTIAHKVLALVSAKTGYPREMLGLDLDLEADLGIDTIKQASIFAELSALFELPRPDELKLRKYPTLGHLITFVCQARPELAQALISVQPQTTSAALHGATTGDDITEEVLALVSAKTGYPREMLGLDMDLEADLGIDTIKQGEILSEIRVVFDLPRSDDLQLRNFPTLGHLISLVRSLNPYLARAPNAAAADASGAELASGFDQVLAEPGKEPMK